MLMKNRKDLKKGQSYYYCDYHNPKLEHQTDGVGVYECVWDDWAEERRKAYGFADRHEYAFKTVKILAWGGRNPDLDRASYMESGWMSNRNFYTTVAEATNEAIRATFADYNPFIK